VYLLDGSDEISDEKSDDESEDEDFDIWFFSILYVAEANVLIIVI
jgi:hypothetical protein